ncbi:MAG TPA: lactonase family protein [Thermodesulfobacteriota bacterium]|nr:lactonase family protein [Thermodesulfobacteriota bacterium]
MHTIRDAKISGQQSITMAGKGQYDVAPGVKRRTFLSACLGIAIAFVLGLDMSSVQAQVGGASAAAIASGKSGPVFAYVGCRTTKERNARGEGINVYRVDPSSGSWTHVQLVGNLVNPSFLAFDRRQNFLYSVHGDFSEVSSFKVNRQTGELTLLNRQSTQGKNPVHLVVDPTNRFLVISNYATGTLALLPIQEDGTLGPLKDFAKLPGNPGPHKVEQTISHPHHNPLDPGERFIIVPDKGLDKIFTFRIDVENGKLIAGPSVETRETSGPRHIVFHPGKAYAYVINELDSTVTTYRYNAERGELAPMQILTALPATFTGNNRSSEIAITTSGRFVYASNRGHDSIAIFAVDQTTGMLSSVGWESTQGKNPRFFSLDPTGAFMYAANENSDTIVTYWIDPVTGKLSPTGQIIKTGSPVCIIFSSGGP